MREIEFRGISKKTKQFRYGNLIKKNGHYYIIPFDCQKDVLICLEEIIPETIGQYSEAVDKNNEKIYEGDILKIEKDKNMFVYGVVYFYCGSFKIKSNHWYYDSLNVFSNINIPSERIEKIGNIFENQELLIKLEN